MAGAATPWHDRRVAEREDEPEKPTPWYLAPLKAMQEMIPERFPLLRLAIPTQVATLSVAYLIVRVTGVKPSPITCKIPFWNAVLLVAGLEIGFMAVFMLLKLLVKEVKLPGYLERLVMALKKTTFLEVVATCASVGFVEEVAFRGVLHPLVGVVVASVLFAAAHRPRMLFHWFVLATMGAVFTYELHVTGGLLVPIVHHALHDLWALGLLFAVLRADPDTKLEGM